MLTEHQLQPIIKALAQAEIPALLLKGQSLARTVYPDPVLRQSQDIDLLVLPEHMKQVEAVFETLGYVSAEPTFDISPYFYRDQTFFSPKKGLPVEGHWALDCIFNMFKKEWISHAFRDQIYIQDPNFRFDTLSHSHHLEYLAFHHIFKPDTINFSWIIDIAFLMKELSRDEWEEIGVESVKNNIRVPMEYALIAGSLWSGYPIPVEYSNFSNWPQPSTKELKIRRCANSLNFQSLYFGVIMCALSDWKEKIRFLYWSMFPPKSGSSSFQVGKLSFN